MIVEFLEEAEQELMDAVLWAAIAHDRRKPGYWKSRV
jgi:hypothetical protein